MSFFKKRKKLIKGQLSDINVELVSLLFDDMKPANRKGFVVKSGDKKMICKGHSTKFKAEEVDGEGRLYVTVYEPDTVDAQGDSASAEEIRKACDRFAKKGMLRKNDINHDCNPVDDAYIAENSILKVADPAHYPDTKVGAWVQTIKFDNLDSPLWKKAKSGKFNGVSLYGEADDSDDRDNLVNEMKNVLQKSIAELKEKNDSTLEPAIKQLQKQLDEMEKNQISSQTEAQIKELGKSLSDVVKTINKAINTQIKGEESQQVTDKEVNINGEKIKIKSAKKELYKALSDVDSGTAMSALADNLGKQFVDSVMDMNPDDAFTDISVVELGKDESIDKGLIEDIILKNTKDGLPDAQEILSGDIPCPTEELCGELELKQNTVEFYKDKLGETEFGAYVDEKLSVKVLKALKTLMYKGDRASTTAKLKGLDGLIKKMTGTDDEASISNTTFPTYAKKFGAMLQEFSEDVLTELANFVIYVSPHTYLSIQDELSQRLTPAGDGFLLKDDKVTFRGIPVKSRNMPDATYIIGISKFILLGYRADVRLKIEHHGSDWKYHWYIRVRFGMAYVPGGFVKLFKEIA